MRLRTGLCILLFLPLIVSSAQQPTAGDLNVPAVRVTSRMVLADVIVTNKTGERAKGLTADDFTLLENGKPQKITAFSLETLTRRANPVQALPEHVYTNRPEYDMPPGPLTIMLLDGINTPVADQGYAREQMLKYLGTQLQPGQPVAVYTLSGSLRLLQDFTADVNLLKAAVEHFTPQKSIEMQVEDVLTIMPNLRGAPDRSGSPSNNLRFVFARMTEFMNEQSKFAIDERVQRTAAAMRLLARRMAGYPGRKNLVWVSAGFPIEITSRVMQMTTDVDVLAQARTAADAPQRVEKSYEDLLRQLAAELTDAQVSVYSVDARGLMGSSIHDASNQGTNEMGLLRIGAEYGAQVAQASTAAQSSQDTLLTLATESGGMTFKNSNDVAGALAASVADGSSYYMLGYAPDAKQWDGKFRKIQVRVNKPGLEVRHRTGYYAKDPMQWNKSKDKRDPELAMAMEMGSPISTMVIFDSRVVPPAPASQMKVPVDFLVNPQTLAGEEMKDGGRHFALEFHVAAYSPDGKLVTHKDAGMDAPVKGDRLQAYLQQGIPYRTELELAPGQYHLRLCVRDGHTGYVGTTEIPLMLAAK